MHFCSYVVLQAQPIMMKAKNRCLYNFGKVPFRTSFIANCQIYNINFQKELSEVSIKNLEWFFGNFHQHFSSICQWNAILAYNLKYRWNRPIFTEMWSFLKSGNFRHFRARAPLGILWNSFTGWAQKNGPPNFAL